MRFNNQNRFTETNHNGWVVIALNPKKEIIKMCLTSLLEGKFYETAKDQIDRLISYMNLVDPDFLLKVALFSREYW
jgi:hypothetical protein